MSNRKNYNSLVFLTTLSVYLGLVLVGGSTPTVLAQAATTRGFDIKNEVVLEDDLDKKPDDESGSSLKAVEELVGTTFPTLRQDFVVHDFTYTLDKDVLFGKLNLKSKFNHDLSPAGHSYVSSLEFLRNSSQNKRETAILENTRITFENNQVFVVTRLPRASIDALLAEKDAQ